MTNRNDRGVALVPAPGRDRRTMTDQEERDSRADVNQYASFGDSPLNTGDFRVARSLTATSVSERPRVRHSRGRRQGQPGMPPPAASTPSPFEAPGVWDTIVIAGVLFLGLATVDGDTANALDVKKHKGRDGGKISDSGAVCAELTVTFRVWDAITWASWEQVFHAIDPQRLPDKRAPVDVSHPALAQRGITRAYVKKVSLPKREGNEWRFTATLIQWMPALTDPNGRSVTRSAVAPTLENTTTAFTGLGQRDDVDDPATTDMNP